MAALIPTLAYTAHGGKIILFILLGCTPLAFGSRNIKVMRSVKWYYTLPLHSFILVLTVVMVPIRLLGLMLCSDDMEWGTRKLEEDNDKVEVP